MYGMGDQLGYGEWFLDALGMLHDKLAPKGVSFIGLLANRRLRVHQ
ncbi:flavodoxin FldB [Enterobacter asburiae]|uniref:Flavodoxin FldB n=1 Tax=Enterobacter asburiae TaxID=61645 RepID=A0A376FGJ8_ENTAS|nr:flavodoxin FldB [Enterobacter asburiae]